MTILTNTGEVGFVSFYPHSYYSQEHSQGEFEQKLVSHSIQCGLPHLPCGHYQEEDPSTCSRTAKYQGSACSNHYGTFNAVYFPKLRDNAQHPLLPLVIPEAETVTSERGDKWDWMREAGTGGAGGGTRYRLSIYW